MDGSDGDGNGICFPYDVLLNILGRLQCRPLAKSRRVCRAWRAIVDGHKLLLRYFFPRGPFPGIFTDNYGTDNESSFFAPPAPRSERPRRARDGPVFRRPLFRHDWASVPHYCNGLLLLKKFPLDLYVCNPATTRYACLPRPPNDFSLFNVGMFLAFDPAVSLHYEVFLLRGEIQPDKEKAISMLVLSSQTMQWVSREFEPRHCAPGHLYDAVTAPHPSDMTRWNSAEYWHGSLYVHCWNNVLMILRNSEEVYDMVPLPVKAYEDKEFVTHAYSYMMPKLQWEAVDSKRALVSLLEARNIEEIIYNEVDGQSNTSDDVDADSDDDQDGVYDADDFNDTTDEVDGGNDDDEDGVYDADEFSETTEDVDGESDDDEDEVYEDGNFSETTDDVDDGGQDEDGDAHEDKDDKLKSEEVSEYSWDSDEDNFIDVDESAAHPEDYGNYRLMGLHPHKDVVLFLTPPGVVAAYHVMTSRIQYLGKKLVRDPWSFYGANIAFPYRPCYVDALPAPKRASYYGR
ncbi:hypothetical protein VPH35_113773 [Triticum aestivum]